MVSEAKQQQPSLEDYQKESKLKIFEIAKTYLQHTQSINPIIIYILLLIECLQILWFSIHPRLLFLNNPFMLSYFRTVLSYLNFQASIQTQNNLLFPLAIVASVLIVLHVGTLVLSIKSMILSKKSGGIDRSQLSTILHKVAAFQVVILNTVLIIPIYNVSVITLYCDKTSIYHANSGQQCYNTMHIVLCILSAINVLILIMESLLYGFIFYIRNPFSKSYYSLPSNLHRLAKLLLKLLPPLYFVIDIGNNFQNIYVIIFMILSLLFVGYFRINSTHSFNQNYFYFQLFAESIIIWFCINSALCTQLTFSGMSFLQSCVCGVLFAAAVCTVEAGLTQKFLESNLCVNVKKQDKQKFVYLLSHVLLSDNNEGSMNPIVYIKLLHSNHNTSNLQLGKKLSKLDIKPEQLKEIARQLLLIIIDKFFEDTNSINLKMTKCLILFSTGFKILSLHEMSEIRQDKLSIYEQFMIYYFKATRQIYQENDIKGNQDNMNEINIYLDFIQNMNGFQNELESCAKNNQQFWEQLCQDMPSINKVYSLAQKSVVFAGKIQEKFKKILSIFPQNLSSLFLYFQFLTHVCAKNKQFNKIRQKWNLQKQREQQKQSLQVENRTGKIKFGPNDKMCVLHVSTSSNSIGIVTNCNSEVKKYLGYEKHELINQKVTKIMPKIYSDIHDKFITDYLKKSDLMRLSSQKTVFAFKKNLRIIETCLAVKIFPSITVGFQLVGFFKQFPGRQDKMNIMVNMKTLQIEGMNQGFLKFAGNMFKLHQIQKEPLKLSNIFPQIQTGYQFKAGECIQTLLRFSDCTDKLIDLDQSSQESRRKFEKVIVLQMDYIKYYQQAKIGIFSVIELQRFTSMHDANSRMSQKKVRIQKVTKHPNQSKKTPIKSSTNLDQEVASIQRKVQQFISKNSHHFQMCLIKIIFFVCFISLTLASVFVNVYQTTFSIQHSQLMEQICLCNNVSILQGKILTQNFYLTELKNDQQKWQACRDEYINYLHDLQDTATALFEKSNSRRTVNLVINQFDLYDFKMMISNASNLQTESLHYIDGILQAVFMGMDFDSKNFTNNSFNTDDQAVDSLYFIEQNMKDTLPNLAQRTTSAYSKYFQQFVRKQFDNDMYFAIAKTSTFLLICTILTLVVKNKSKFNDILIKIYCNILKWDAYELYSKCHKFREKSFEINNQAKQKQSSRHSDLVRMFPKSLIIKLSEGIINRSNDGKQGGKEIKTSILMNKSNKSKNNEQTETQNKNDHNYSLEPISSKSDLINLKVQSSLFNKCLLVFILLMALISINFVALYFKSQFNSQIITESENSVNLGKYRKSFLFTLFYGIHISKGNEQYRHLYNIELQSFYDISKKVSSLVGDPQPYLRQIYKQIEIVNSIATNQLKSVSQSKIDQLLSTGQSKLFEMSDQIGDLAASRTQSQFAQIESIEKTMRIIKIILDIVATLLFVRIAVVYLLKAAQNQLNHSCNMMKMIPIWLVSKSINILKIISADDVAHDKKKKRIKNMDDQSATNLISNNAI